MRAPTKKQTFTILVCLLLLGTLAFYLTRPNEPIYQGKTLTQWLQQYNLPGVFDQDYDAKREPERKTAERALHAIGTNSIPTLLRLLGSKDSPGALQIESFFRRHGFENTRLTHAEGAWYLALSGFGLLGTNGASAIPELRKYVMTHNGRSTLRALDCLAIVENGSDYSTESSLQLLLKLFRDSDNETAYRGATLLAGYHPDAAKNAGVYKRFPQLAPPTADNSSPNPPATD
jgi:hypothetical protein